MLCSVPDENRSICVRSHGWSGLIHVRLRKYPDAKRAYINAIHLEPRWSEPRLCLTEVYRILGNNKAARLHKEALRELDPNALKSL
jgi:cytochrome c-type biogenesis protein CcmH/NrfG